MVSYINKRTGFTIVELLIVIVVIGILAAISIVAYNGVTANARNAAITANVDGWVKLMNLYRAENGSFPDSGGISVCLGSTSEYPANGNLKQGSCTYVHYGDNSTPDSWAMTNEPMMTKLRTYSSSLPQGAVPLFSYSGNGNIQQNRGIYYLGFAGDSTTPTGANILYWVDGDRKCPRGTASTNGSVTFCILTL